MMDNAITIAQLESELKAAREKISELERSRENEGSKPWHVAVHHASMDSFWLMDTTGRILDVNRIYCNLIGYTRDELLTMTVTDVEVAESQQQTSRRFKEISKRGYGHFETQHRTRNGDIIDLEISARYLSREGGGYVIFLREITERKRQEQKLIDEQERFRAFFDNAPIGKCMTAPDGRLQEVNSALCDLLGYDADHLTTLNFNEITHPDDIEKSRECVRSLLAGEKESCRMEKRYQTRDGRYIWTDVTTKLLHDDEGQPRFFLTNIFDISKQQETELRLRESIEALAESNRRLEGAQEVGKIASYEYDLVTNTYWATNEAKRIYGYSLDLEEFSYDDVWRCIPDKEFVQQAWVDLIEKDKPYDIEHEIIPASGSSSKYISAVGKVVRDDSGNPIKVLGFIQDITEKYRMQAELIETQQIAGLGRWELDMRDNTLRWSESICELFEVDSTSFVTSYEAFLGFVHPDDRETVSIAFLESVKTRSPYSLVHRLQMPDGRIKWVKELGQTFYAEDGTPLRSVGTVQDITKLQIAHEELRESDKQYRSLFDNAPVGVFKTTSEGRLLSANPALATMLGFQSVEDLLSNSEDLGRQLYVDPQRLNTFIVEIETAGEVTAFECEARITDNRVIWLTISARVAERFGDGSFTIEGFASDFTERKQLEQAMKRSEHLLNLTGSIASVGGWEMDLDSMSPFLTEEVLRIYDLPLKYHLPPEQGITYYHPDDMPKVQQAFRRAVEKGEPYDMEVRFISAKGNHKWIQTIGRPLVIDGKLTKIYGSIQDITERKLAEKEKAQIETRLQQAQKMEAIGTLAGGIAHDFNNILSVILGYADLAIEEAPVGTKYQGFLKEILTATNRARDLVKQILTFSRQSQVDRISMKIQPLIKEGLKMLRSSIPTTISITENIDPKSGLILADATQIHQILMNLCTNAYHAMEPTGGTLSVTLKNSYIDTDDQVELARIKAGKYVELAVSDTGIGISPDVIGSIFDPFFTTKESGKGTGMGLAIIHGIVSDYGGSITVDSELGKGSTFRVYFPLIQDGVARDLQEAGDLPNGSERILFVDDEEMLAEMSKQVLERLGYHVTIKSSSIEALSIFQNTPNNFDLVITDQTMPNMTGSDLARKMMQIRPDIPIILCTGFSNIIDEDSAKALGIKEFALKPLTKDALSKLIRKVLDDL